MNNTVKDYEQMVKSLGKFEGCNRYVPYLWLLDGGYDDTEIDCGGDCIKECDSRCDCQANTIFIYNINDNDIKLFPELKDIKQVKLIETDTGFVCEL